ncbi:MAG: hypothetical protein KKG33_14805 [candidate division Zixibacteria bacterium]|nr:hypothetical protein [candidate division Zixibacteria bacterium]MBU1469689.1 hypothetical protein [candidate division Zixibacteria bacterium]MBU2626820.1 hypothetical protein [candidate division Zixibacteria bacterium]
MAEIVRKVDYFYALVGDKPGEARLLLEHLSEKGVNLIAFTAFPVGDGRTQVDFIPEDVQALQWAASEADIKLVGPKKVFLIQGEDRVGALHDHHLQLANAGVNVLAANGVADGRGGFGYVLWVKPEDIDKAAKALGA